MDDAKYVSKDIFDTAVKKLSKCFNDNTQAINDLKYQVENHLENERYAADRDLYNRILNCEQSQQMLLKELNQMKAYISSFSNDAVERISRLQAEVAQLKSGTDFIENKNGYYSRGYKNYATNTNIVDKAGNIGTDRPLNDKPAGSRHTGMAEKKNSAAGSLSFLEDYYQLSSREFMSCYGAKELALSNFSELRTGVTKTPEFRDEAGGYILLHMSGREYLLPEKSFLENSGNHMVIGTVFDVDAELLAKGLSVRNVKTPSVLKRKDSNLWTCVEKGKIKA